MGLYLPFIGLFTETIIQFKLVHQAYFTPYRLHKMSADGVEELRGTLPIFSGPALSLSGSGRKY